MGLDITAYSHLHHIGKHEKDPARNEGEPGGLNDWCYYDNHVQAFAYDTFPASFRGIPILGTDVLSGTKFLVGGCYEHTEHTETHAFRAGSYTGYSEWRSDLQSRLNPARDPDGPFYELIWFADNEGTIGPDAARDLLVDFEQNAERYNEGASEDWLRAKYADWTQAFRLAADGGLVHFH